MCFVERFGVFCIFVCEVFLCLMVQGVLVSGEKCGVFIVEYICEEFV